MLIEYVCFFSLILGILMFHQCDYDLDYERLETVCYNKVYMVDFKTKTFKFNRTTTAFNISVDWKLALGNDLVIVAQAYKFSSNEYRLFPMRLGYNFCEGMARDDFGFSNMLECGTFSGCPLIKGKQQACNWFPDQQKFPPFIPTGRFMLEVELVHFDVQVALFKAYASVVRPFGNKIYC